MRRLAWLVLVPALASCGGISGITVEDVATAGKGLFAGQKDYTPEEERAVGRVVAARVLGTYPQWQDRARAHYLNLVGHTVARQVGRPGTVWHFALLDTDTVNAFSCPGGYVLVTRGLFEFCRNEAELATVLAHECGHVAGEHVLREIRRAEVIGAGVSIVASHAGEGGMTTELMEKIGQKGFDVLLNRGLDRKDELDADARGCRVARGAGYATAAYADFLRRLEAQMGSSGGTGVWASLGKTHPSAAVRLEALTREGLLLSDGQVLEARFRKLGR